MRTIIIAASLALATTLAACVTESNKQWDRSRETISVDVKECKAISGEVAGIVYAIEEHGAHLNDPMMQETIEKVASNPKDNVSGENLSSDAVDLLIAYYWGLTPHDIALGHKELERRFLKGCTEDNGHSVYKRHPRLLNRT